MLFDVLHKPDARHEVIFIIGQAEAEHGLRRTEVRPYTCDCGCELTPERLDEGDRQKTSWPNCKSWRDGGNKRCPSCNSKFHMPPREQMGRTFGYEVRPKDDYSDSVTDARKRRAREEYGETCLLCESADDLGYVKIVPQKFYGTADPPNLVPFCTEHKPRHHVFLDISYPGKWARFRNRVKWESYVADLREQYADEGHEGTKFVDHLDALLEKGPVPPRDLYWRAKNLSD